MKQIGEILYRGIMYPHFIEVHDKEDDILVSINIDCIANFFPKGDGDGTIINCRDCGGQITTESYEEIKKLITDSGCQIQMGDPRLDQSHPLTMNDLKHMIGEPVWNSNASCWMLVSEDRGLAVYLIYNAGNGYDCDEDCLIKFPLYRMKR